MQVERDVPIIAEPQPTTDASSAPPSRFPIERWLDSSFLLFGAFLFVAAIAFGGALLTVHNRQTDEVMQRSGPQRTHLVLSHWLNEGYFHYAGMLNRFTDKEGVYKNSTGAYMISGLIVEKLYIAIVGHYSYRLVAVHNQIVSMILCALAGLLCFRLARRTGLEPRLAFTAGASVVVVLFTFPDNLHLYWEMSAQAYGLLFALLFLLIEERIYDHPSRNLMIARGATFFFTAVMESLVALGIVAALAFSLAILRSERSWKQFIVTIVLPCLAAIAVYQLQVKIAAARFPEVEMSGSRPLWRTGLDGESRYYGDHFDLADRTAARNNWKTHREHLFHWKGMFILGVLSVAGAVVAFLLGRVPRVVIEVLVALIGSWLLYAAIFSQAVVIHPYLFDVLLFTPLCIALFAIAPSILEAATGRTGAILLIFAISAFCYSLVQMRLYALRWPLPPVPPAVVTSLEIESPSQVVRTIEYRYNARRA